MGLWKGEIMPVQSCGKGGKRWGKHGKCYHGKDATKKAARQGRAIKASQSRRKKGK